MKARALINTFPMQKALNQNPTPEVKRKTNKNLNQKKNPAQLINQVDDSRILFAPQNGSQPAPGWSQVSALDLQGLVERRWFFWVTLLFSRSRFPRQPKPAGRLPALVNGPWLRPHDLLVLGCSLSFRIAVNAARNVRNPVERRLPLKCALH